MQRRGEEAWAEAMIGAHLGLQVEEHDDGSAPRMYDLTIFLPGGAHAAVEVTSCADSESIETWNLMNGDDEEWVFPDLTGGWLVAVSPHARVKRLKTDLPAFLLQLEREKITETHSRRTPEWVQSTCRSLGIGTAHQGGTDRSGSVYLTIELPPERSGGFVPHNGDSVARWIGDFLREPQQQDVSDKLQQSGFDQRHTFIFVPGFTAAPWPVPYLLTSERPPVPNTPPDLPSAITHVWVASTWDTATGLYWSPDTGWTHFSKAPRP
jgi:hypothetical protein